ncbi:hypothetical protein [Metaplanococcus flavidus]|uniref:Uncharacterized protein n=1 Tax=Metaplanococcus flavidus TaxID=569883 RepID=A0ABW3LB32_9BACL
MTAIIKEEKKMDTAPKTYLKMYENYIDGYRQYKQGKATPAPKTAKS